MQLLKPLLLFIFFILKLNLTVGQPVNLFTFPVITKEGLTVESFIPDGWKLADSTNGDLNGDNESDFAIVIESKDSLITFTHTEQFGEEIKVVNKSVKQIRRILIIAIRDSQNKKFNLSEQHNSIIIGTNAKIEIDSSFMKIKYTSNNNGLNYFSNSTYYFSYENETFLLTKVERSVINGLWYEENVFDFVNRNWSSKKGKINAGQMPETILKSLDTIQPKTMKEFEKPFVWHIVDDIYL